MSHASDTVVQPSAGPEGGRKHQAALAACGPRWRSSSYYQVLTWLRKASQAQPYARITEW